MRKVGMTIGCMAVLGMAGTSWGALGAFYTEDFESYGSTGALQAVWAGVGTLDTVEGSDGIGGSAPQSAFHSGDVGVNRLVFSAVSEIPDTLVPTASEWIKLSVDVLDWADPNPAFIDPVTTPAEPEFLTNPDNKRFTLGMRGWNGNPFDSVTENILEMGHWNATEGEDPGTPVPHFAHRSVIFAGLGTEPNGTGWDGFELGTMTDPNDPLATIEVNSFQGGGGLVWHRYSVTIGPDTVIFDIDLDMDGTPEATRVLDGLTTTALGFTELRFGSPSDVGSGDGGGNFDNIVLELVAPVESCGTLAGDLNCDGFVGVDDLNIILLNWNQNVTPGDLPTGDPTGDGFVGVDDLNIVLVNWNNGTPPAAGAAIPEPASLALLGLGGFAMLRRRR